MHYSKYSLFALCALCCVLLSLSGCGTPKDLTSPNTLTGGDRRIASPLDSDSDQTFGAVRSKTKIALLVPLSGRYAPVGQAILQAAHLALFDLRYTHMELLPFDTKGTPLGAVRAFKKAADKKVQLVLGPLFSNSAKAVAPLVYDHDINAIVFSNDSSLQNKGVFLLGILPEQQAARVVDYTYEQGHHFWASVAPNDTFGANVTRSMRKVVEEKPGGHVAKTEFIAGNQSVNAYVRRAMRSLTRSSTKRLRIIELTQRLKELQKQNKTLEEYADVTLPAANTDETAETQPAIELTGALRDKYLLLSLQPGNLSIEELVEQELAGAEADKHALFIAANGKQLHDIAKRVALYDMQQHSMQLTLSAPATAQDIKTSPILEGALYADIPQERHRLFEERYLAFYTKETEVPRVASLGYDGVALAVMLAQRPGNGFSYTQLLDKHGYAGIDGAFRFMGNGLNERALAVYRATAADEPELVEDAAQRF